jgi:GNAT superfamily N-acetyltransferase
LFLKVIGHFSAVSVPPKYEKKGVGKHLVQAAESKVISVAHEIMASQEANCKSCLGMASSGTKKEVTARMEMGVVNLRDPLFHWYENQGYVAIGPIIPNDPGFDMLLSDEYKGKTHLILLRKNLLI